MEIRIGIANSPREVSFESSESIADVKKTIQAALDDKSSYFSLTDAKGSLFIIPTAGLAYVEVGSEDQRRVGFVA